MIGMIWGWEVRCEMVIINGCSEETNMMIGMIWEEGVRCELAIMKGE